MIKKRLFDALGESPAFFSAHVDSYVILILFKTNNLTFFRPSHKHGIAKFTLRQDDMMRWNYEDETNNILYLQKNKHF